MTLQDFINQTSTGQPYGDGECGSLVRAYMIEVQNYTPPSYPSAKDYWFNNVPGYSHQTSPEPGDIAVYNAHGPTLPDGSLEYPDGHIAIYVGNGEVFEQNADPDGSPPHLFARSNTYLLGYLRQEGNIMADEALVTTLYQGMLLRDPDPAGLNYWVGKEVHIVVDGIYNSPEAQNLRAAYRKQATEITNAKNDLSS